MKRLNLLLLMLAVAFVSQVQAVVYLDLDGNKVESSYTASNDFMEMYLADERFYAYYEKVAPKAADFLYEAMKIYLEK